MERSWCQNSAPILLAQRPKRGRQRTKEGCEAQPTASRSHHLWRLLSGKDSDNQAQGNCEWDDTEHESLFCLILVFCGLWGSE